MPEPGPSTETPVAPAQGACENLSQPSATPAEVSETPAPSQPLTMARVLTELRGPAFLAVLWLVAPAVSGTALLYGIGPVSQWLAEDRARGLAVYVAAFALTAGLGLLPTYAQALLGGWTFGFAAGFPAALAGFAGGALLGYAIVRAVASSRVQHVIEQEPRARVVRTALLGGSALKVLALVTLIRMPPNSPFALTNLVLSSTGVPKRTYLAGTVLGMAPRTGLAVALGAAVGEQGRSIAEVIKQGPPLPVVIGAVALTLIIIAVIGRIAKKALDKLTAEQTGAAER